MQFTYKQFAVGENGVKKVRLPALYCLLTMSLLNIIQTSSLSLGGCA